MTFFSTAEKLALGGMPFVVATEKPTRRDALAYYREVVDDIALAVRQYERVERIERDGERVRRPHARRAAARPRRRRARAVVVATGYFGSPNLLGVPGEELPHVTHRYREGHEAFMQRCGRGRRQELRRRSGARPVALRCARDAGALRRRLFDRAIKPWVLPDLQNRITEGQHRDALERRGSSRSSRSDVVLGHRTVPERLPADHVYLLTGYAPDIELLREVGVAIDADDRAFPRTIRRPWRPTCRACSSPASSVAGNDANKVFIENGRGHGELIARRLSRHVGRPRGRA